MQLNTMTFLKNAPQFEGERWKDTVSMYKGHLARLLNRQEIEGDGSRAGTGDV